MAIEGGEVVLDSRIQIRNDTAAAWKAANPVLLKGEIGIEIDTRKIKFGDGISTWETLKYVSDDIVVATVSPSDKDTAYDVGELWVNQSDKTVFVLIATTERSAVWKRIATGEELLVVAEAQVAQKLKVARTISIVGDGTGAVKFDGSEDAVITLVLRNTGVTAGTFTKLTVNEQGLIIKSELLKASDIPALTLAKITDAGSAAAKDVGTKPGNLVELDEGGKIDRNLLPSVAITEPFAVSSEAEMLALNAQKGDVAIRTDESKSYILKTRPATDRSNWLELLSPDCRIVSVNGQIGAVVLTTADINEKTNLYFTKERAAEVYTEKLGETSSKDLTDGETILHSTDKIILNGGGA